MRGFALVSVVGLTIAFCASQSVAGAQDAPAWDGSGFRIDAISSRSGQSAPIKLTLPKEATTPNARKQELTFLLFQGVPEEVTLSVGFKVKNAWVVSLRDLGALSLKSSPAYNGSFELLATLREGDVNAAVCSAAVELTQGGGRIALARSAITEAAPEKSAPSLAAGEALSKGDEASLLERGADLLKQNDFEAARLIFTDLAERGSGAGAFALAQTYDPKALKAYFVIGLKPDLERARQWYNKAAELGSREAVQRLSALK
jgi:hypothetical protein